MYEVLQSVNIFSEQGSNFITYKHDIRYGILHHILHYYVWSISPSELVHTIEMLAAKET